MTGFRVLEVSDEGPRRGKTSADWSIDVWPYRRLDEQNGGTQLTFLNEWYTSHMREVIGKQI